MTGLISGIICSTDFDHSTATIISVTHMSNSNSVDTREKGLQFLILKHACVCFNCKSIGTPLCL